jgi:hypothetical protein
MLDYAPEAFPECVRLAHSEGLLRCLLEERASQRPPCGVEPEDVFTPVDLRRWVEIIGGKVRGEPASPLRSGEEGR